MGGKKVLTLQENCDMINLVSKWYQSLWIRFIYLDASVAQSVEQLIRNQQVRCSSHPTSSTGRPENDRFRGVLLCKKFLI